MQSKSSKKNPNKLLEKLSPSTNELKGFDVESLQKSFVNHLEFSLAKDRYSATQRDFFKSIAYTIRDRLFERWIQTQQTYYNVKAKRIYYMSMEYMMGRMLGNAIINLKLTDNVEKALWELGLNLEDMQEIECDAGLGNGGLGRLAACFLDSMATLELPANGYGIRYEYGIFAQKIKNNEQVELPDQWLRYGNPWEVERPEFTYTIKFYGKTNQYTDGNGNLQNEWIDTDDIIAVAYDTPVPGYNNDTVNNLRLWSAKSSEEFNLEYFNHGDYDRAVEDKIQSEVISKVLYPRDDLLQGRELRLKQEYFLVSASIQDILRRFKKIYKNNFSKLPQNVAIQLNDTHPVLSIPELMRILVDYEKLPWEKAWDITTKTFGYTNHTILPEALEKWRINLMERVLPRHMQIIFEINQRFLKDVVKSDPNDLDRLRRMSIIEEGNEKKIRMANLAIVGSHSLNGVAALHSELLKSHVFEDFYKIWPKKFNNKTNGITQRRWLKLCNPELSHLITETIGDKWIIDLYKLKELEKFAEDKSFQNKWRAVKKANKQKLVKYIESKQNVKINVNSIFDCQVKRIHEYKRQLLNALHVITLYNRIKNGLQKNSVPRTVIFSGKAAPAYLTAKLIIKLINNLAVTVNNDPDIGNKLKVIFLPDYSVSLAEKIVPAADLSEQISTAGMEASGTGNMKMALNGALTIGTLDGANIEIKEEVGADNIFIFGLKADEVMKIRTEGYSPIDLYNKNDDLRNAIDMIYNGYFSKEETELFKPLIRTIMEGDYYLIMNDFISYVQSQEIVNEIYRNPFEWTKKSIINTANMGKFSSDRTINEYANNIWNVKPVSINL